ncbi:MAG: hypothetical protein AAF901_04300, partial [Bacteroidota bacterium]
MKLSEYRRVYQERSKQASDVNRQFALAGLAVIWIFKINEEGEVFLNDDFKVSLFLLIASLAFDLLHYIGSATIWSIFYRIKENQFLKQKKESKKVTDDPEFEHSATLVF